MILCFYDSQGFSSSRLFPPAAGVDSGVRKCNCGFFSWCSLISMMNSRERIFPGN